MSIPTLNAVRSLGPPVGVYRSFKRYSEMERHRSTHISTQFNVDGISNNDADYWLAACARSHIDTGKDVYPPEHCFLKLVDRSSSTAIDSLSFSHNQVAASPDYKPDHPANRCQMVQSITWEKWQQLRNYFQRNCAPEQFDMDTHNCCSCTKDAVESVIGVSVPSNITEANDGLGTRQ
ncbi:MAG: hypothetical protein AAGD25_20395 [Cyanobacteria bacterium P01_F01_bin.150]